MSRTTTPVMTKNLTTFCHVRSRFIAEGLTLPCIQPAPALKDDWKAASFSENLPDWLLPYIWLQRLLSSNHLHSYHCHDHYLLPGLLVVCLNRAGRFLPLREDQIDLAIVLFSRWIFTVRHFEFPDYEIVYKPPKVRKYTNKHWPTSQNARQNILGKGTDVLSWIKVKLTLGLQH